MFQSPFEAFSSLLSDSTDLPENIVSREGIPPATRKQKDYIKGLCKKIGIDYHNDLPGDIKDVDQINLEEASTLIEELKDEVYLYGGSSNDYF